jgi:soluble lytic murein transglycosylase
MMRHFGAGLIAAVLGLAFFAPFPPAMTNEAIDSVVTGSIKSGAATETLPDPKGSAAFRAALELLDGGDAVGAFAEAARLENSLERRTIQWVAIYYNAGKVDAAAVAEFAKDAPDFATASLFQTRIEQSLSRGEAAPSPEAVIAALGGTTAPNTIDGQIMLAEALLAAGETERATGLARQLWADNFLTEQQENRITGTLGSLIDQETHWARAMHLMMHDRARGSERLLPLLSPAQQSLVVARAAVSRNDADAKKKLDSVDASMQANPVFIFSRAQRARQFELWESAVDWLSKAPETVPDAAEWWYERRLLVRKLLDVGQPGLAYEAAAGYVAGPEGRLVDAHFHAGWIALAFLDNATSAKAHFTAMAALATLPDTVTQANYWLARANQRLGDVPAAEAAFEAATRYGTVFYGQLARAELGKAGVDIRPLPDGTPAETLFHTHQVVKAVRLLAANGKANLAVPLLRHFGTGRQNGGDLLLAAQLAQEIGAHHLAIAIAGTAEQRGSPLDPLSFPQNGLPEDIQLAADRAAVYAITRQESMFQVDAVSSAGARGMMQLMPGTAQDVARKLGLDYSPSRLVTDAGYNTLLGSTYLASQLQRYDGSLVLAAAAYNAGPGNADKWIRNYGDPRADNVDPVVWVELIPFHETRTYVKRVLGNYLVFRQLLGDGPLTQQQALRRID